MLDNKAVLILGYFDGVHKGHKTLIDTAKKFDCKCVIVSFGGNLKKALNKKTDSVLYTKEERLSIYKDLKLDDVLFLPTTEKFLSKTPKEFLDYLNKKYDVLGYVSGEDYKFGKDRRGDVKFLNSYAKEKGQELKILPEYREVGVKVSSTEIKKLIISGEIEKANELLIEPFFIKGKVIHGRGEGKVLGFPTVNLKIDKDKIEIKRGVYYGIAKILGKKYKAMINYGTCPTFNKNKLTIEAHVIDFNGDIYGKEIKLSFIKFIRETQKFNSIDGLTARLYEDRKNIKEGKYD